LCQASGFFRVLWFPPQIKLTAMKYWNIVESGIKHHNPNPALFTNFSPAMTCKLRLYPYFVTKHQNSL
jgi:hypothetical protein